MDKDYGEIFCQAVDTIVGEKLKGISFDQTIVCSIQDDSKRAEGIYTVSDGSIRFDAYSDNTGYRTGNEVYVSIPQGDWAQQKFITGKKTNKDNQKYIYSTPFSTFLDMTGNVLVGDKYDITTKYETGALVANNVNEERILVKRIDFTKNGEELYQAGYNRLGIKADFRSWLRDFGVVEGNYGIQLLIKCANNEVGNASEDVDIIAELDCSEMNGNPYSFNTYYEQEKVFDISNYSTIKSIAIYFYQKSNFKDKDGQPISPYDGFDNLLSPNLFVQSPYISLGYDISQFEKDITIVFSNDKLTYSATNSNNEKGLMLRWIRDFDDTIRAVNEKNELPIGTSINWYRYELGSSSADKYSGVYWKYLAKYNYDYQYKEISIASEEEYNNKLLYYFDEKDQIYKVASAYSEEIKYYEKTESPEHVFVAYLENGLASDGEDPLSIAFTPDVTLQDEKVKAIIYCNGSRYYSNILTFENEREVVSKPTVDAIQALSLNCEDNTYGNYKIYNHDNSLIDSAQSYKERKLTAVFSSRLTGNTEGNVDEYKISAESITWYIPAENTMIKFDTTLEPTNGYYVVHQDKGTDNKVSSQLSYKIKSQYSHANSNNIIKCELVKDKTTYTAIKEFTFGQAGTTGTEATLILDFVDSNRNAMTLGDTEVVEVKAFLYDYENNLIDLSNKTNLDFSWNWRKETNSGLIETPQKKKNEDGSNIDDICQLQLKEQVTNDDLSKNFHILELTLKGWGDYDLYGYLPIPIRTDAKYTHITGATSILYDTSGALVDYYKNPYVLHGIDTQPNWSLNGEDVGDKYSPQLNNNCLVPLNFFIKNSNKTLNVYCDYWSQPILVLQNRYFNKQVNDWNGELTLDEENNIIMSAQIAAGSKDGDNQFSGVILGSWKQNNTAKEATSGLYGYNKGSQSFGFREDGTAFIGKSGAGRIVFDGNKSTISSTAYENDEGGLALDLVNGKITIVNPKNPEKSGTILFDSTARRTPFKIGNNFSVDWDGTISATDGSFNGNIEADEGYIGDWEISDGSISAGDTTLGSDGTLTIGKFKIGLAESGKSYLVATPYGGSIENAPWGMSGDNPSLAFYAGYDGSNPDGGTDAYNIMINNDGTIYCKGLYVNGVNITSTECDDDWWIVCANGIYSVEVKNGIWYDWSRLSGDNKDKYGITYDSFSEVCGEIDDLWDEISDLKDEIANLKPSS